MMKLKYSICCGLDVHKNVIVVTIVTTDNDGISEYIQKSFSTINSDRLKKVQRLNPMRSLKPSFTPTDYEELMNPQNHVERVILNDSNIFSYLETLGYDSSKLVKRNDN